MELDEKNCGDIADDLTKLQIHDNDEVMTIVIEDDKIICDRTILAANCDYFKALIRFDEKVEVIELKNEISGDVFNIIYEFLLTGSLGVDLSNFQAVLHGSQFLQCKKSEDQTILFISQHLSRENVFSVHQFGEQLMCHKLIKTCRFYIDNVFKPVFDLIKMDLNQFLHCKDDSRISQLLDTSHQISEDLLLLSAIGWIKYSFEERSKSLKILTSLINFRLVSLTTLQYLQDDEDLKDISDQITEAINYKDLRIDEKIKFWRNNEHLRGGRWPTMIVIGSGGTSHSSLSCCVPSKSSAGDLGWRNLTKKPKELTKASTGCSMVYSQSRLYFLGGEKNWYLHYYDLETNKWGVARGAPPARLLSGGCELAGDLYLVGGVRLEEWEGVAGGRGQVSTSSSVDRFSVRGESWSPCLDLETGRSSPGVIAAQNKIWVFGGLRRREMLTSCCCYHPETDSWRTISSLPEKISYFSLVLVDNVIWILGGLDQGYVCRNTTFTFDLETEEFTRGPDLIRARKGNFSFVDEDRIFCCGGSEAGMSNLTTYEVLDLRNIDQGWSEHKLNLKTCNMNLVSVTTFLPVRFLPQ